MTWTKGMLVDQAFDELALAGYVFDLTPEERQSALRRLDAMMATWINNGMTLPYAFSVDQGDSSLSADSGIPMIAVEAVYLALAIRIAASKGKALAPSTKENAKGAYDALASRLARDAMQEQQFRSGVPAGAGQKLVGTVRNPFLPEPDAESVSTSLDGGLSFT